MKKKIVCVGNEKVEITFLTKKDLDKIRCKAYKYLI